MPLRGRISTKDFLQTVEDLVFAVVAHETENRRAMCFLRYIPSAYGSGWKKLDTAAANQFLLKNYPEYLYHAEIFDADLHGVLLKKIKTHHSSLEGLQRLLSLEKKDPLQEKLSRLSEKFIKNSIPLEYLGITGSLLIGAQNDKSDMDFVVHDRESFQKLRELIKYLIRNGQLKELNEEDWLAAYGRRNCSLSLQEYIWHEKRKYNKAVFEGVKFDISLCVIPPAQTEKRFNKVRPIKFQTGILSDHHAFDTPARYGLTHKKIGELICATPTYSGQAFKGESVEISGILEQNDDGIQRVIVGTSREAHDEFVRVIG